MRFSDSKTASKSDVAHCCATRACVNFADRKFDGCAEADFLRAHELIRSNLRWWNFWGIYTYSGEKYIVQHIVRTLMTQGKRWCIPKWAGCTQKRASTLKSERAHFWMSELAQKWAGALLNEQVLLEMNGVWIKMNPIRAKLSKFAYKWASLLENKWIPHKLANIPLKKKD